VAAGRRSPWSARRKVSLAQLLDEPWILSPVEMEPGAPVAEAFRAIGVERPRATIWSQSLNLRNNLLASGRFLTVIPGSVLRFGPQRYRVEGASDQTASLAAPPSPSSL
jgi:LysR substrate binding domain